MIPNKNIQNRLNKTYHAKRYCLDQLLSVARPGGVHPSQSPHEEINSEFINHDYPWGLQVVSIHLEKLLKGWKYKCLKSRPRFLMVLFVGHNHFCWSLKRFKVNGHRTPILGDSEVQGTRVLTVIYKQTRPYFILSYFMSLFHYWPQSSKSICILKTQNHKIDMISSTRFNSLSASGVMGLAKCCNGSTVTRISGVLGSRMRRFEGFFTCPAEKNSEFYTDEKGKGLRTGVVLPWHGHTKTIFFNRKSSMSHVIPKNKANARGRHHYVHSKSHSHKGKVSGFFATNLPAFLNSNQHSTIGTA